MNPGILEQQAVQQPGTQPVEPTTEPQKPSGLVEPKADPEEMDMFIANGMKLIHTPNVSDVLIEKVVKSQDKEKALAEATLAIVSRIEKSAEAAGRELSLGTISNGGNVLLGELISLAEAAGMEKMTDEDKYKAFSFAVSKYIEEAVQSGKMTKEQLMAYAKEAGATPEGQKIVSYGEKIDAGGQPEEGGDDGIGIA